MPEIYGSWASRRENIVTLGTLTSVSSTAAVEVSGTNFTFVHEVDGNNITTVDQGSLDGENWFSLDEAKSHSETGVSVGFYPDRVVRFVRSCITAMGSGTSVTITMACD